MHPRSLSRPLVLLVASLAAGSCSGLTTLGMKQKVGLGQVDELLSHVERVQVECAVAKERAQDALDGLRRLVAPEFHGDAVAAHAELSKTVELSVEQAEALKDSVRPLRRTAESVFERWTADLESFGNLAMRQRSQERLEETRRRYDAVVAAAVAAQLALDSFDGDLSDHLLFLEHDFNATSVALIAQEMDGLRTRSKELARRLDACGSACQAYTEFSAPRAQVEPTPEPAPEVKAAPPGEPAPAPLKAAPRKKPGSKPAATGTPKGA